MKRPEILKYKTIKSNLYLIEAGLWLLVLLAGAIGIALSSL